MLNIPLTNDVVDDIILFVAEIQRRQNKASLRLIIASRCEGLVGKQLEITLEEIVNYVP